MMYLSGRNKGSYKVDKIAYDTRTYQFLDIIQYWFEDEGILPMSGLPNLHLERTYDLFERENDQSTIWHKKYYEMIRSDSSFNDVYINFLMDIIKMK